MPNTNEQKSRPSNVSDGAEGAEEQGQGTRNSKSPDERFPAKGLSLLKGLHVMAGRGLASLLSGFDNRSVRNAILLGALFVVFVFFVVPDAKRGFEEVAEGASTSAPQDSASTQRAASFRPGASSEAYIMRGVSEETFVIGELPSGNLVRVQTYDKHGNIDRRWVRLVGVWALPPRPSNQLTDLANRMEIHPEKALLFGRAARAAVDRLAGGRTLALQVINPSGGLADTTAVSAMPGGKTSAHPLNAYLWVLGDDGRGLYLVNEELVRSGLALFQAQSPHPFEERFRKAAEEAQRYQRGLWAPGAGQAPTREEKRRAEAALRGRSASGEGNS